MISEEWLSLGAIGSGEEAGVSWSISQKVTAPGGPWLSLDTISHEVHSTQEVLGSTVADL